MNHSQSVKYFLLLLVLIPRCFFAQTTPNLLYGTYLGGANNIEEVRSSMLPDGNLVLFTTTNGVENIATEGAFMDAFAGGNDCWLTKITTDGTPIWSTYFGGIGYEVAWEVECDSAGNIYISGETTSQDLPTTSGAFQETAIGTALSDDHPFIAKFDIDGELIWCTYFDSAFDQEAIRELEWSESDQRLYILGELYASGLATPGAYYEFEGSVAPAVLAAFSPDGSMIYATYLPWEITENGMAVDSNGNLYIGFKTNQLVDLDFDDAYKSLNEGYDGLLVHFDDTGWPVWATYFGGEASDIFNTVECDAFGNICIGGWTDSVNGIATPGAYKSSFDGDYDGFIGKFSQAGELLWSTYFGTSEDYEGVDDIYNGADGLLYLRLHTYTSASLTVSSNTFQPLPGGGIIDEVIAQVTSDGDFQWISFIGGAGNEYIQDIAITSNGELLITGSTNSPNIYATEGAIQPELEGYNNAFLLVFDPTVCIYGCTQPEAFNFNPLATCDDGNCILPDQYDLNLDGVVDINDLLLLMEEFGCISDCLADLDGDGIVGMQDVILMIGEL